MRIVSFGPLYLDYYFNNGEILGVNGGGSASNMIANLSKNNKTAFIGFIGSDMQGKIVLDSLNRLGVDTTNIEVLDTNTNMLFNIKNSTSNKCPYCDRLVNIHEHDLKTKVINNIKEDDLIIVDNINDDTLEILECISNKAYLNLSYLGDDLYLSLDELVEKIKDKFEIINLDVNVYTLLKRKYLIDSIDISELFNTKLLIIDRKLRGADFIYEGMLLKKEVEDVITNETDSIGASDVFFSEIIKYFINNKEINEKSISMSYIQAASTANMTRKLIGARNHLMPNYKITNYKECICKKIDVNL